MVGSQSHMAIHIGRVQQSLPVVEVESGDFISTILNPQKIHDFLRRIPAKPQQSLNTIPSPLLLYSTLLYSIPKTNMPASPQQPGNSTHDRNVRPPSPSAASASSLRKQIHAIRHASCPHRTHEGTVPTALRWPVYSSASTA